MHKTPSTPLFRRTISILVVCGLLLQALVPALRPFSAPDPANAAPDDTDVVWATVDLHGDDNEYEIHAVLRQPDSSLPYRAISGADIGNIRSLYVRDENGNAVFGPDAEEAVLLAQGVRQVNDYLSEEGISSRAFLKDEYVRDHLRTPIGDCTGEDPFSAVIFDGIGYTWIEDKVFLHDHIFWNGIDCLQTREEWYAEALLGAALQTEFLPDSRNSGDLLDHRLVEAMRIELTAIPPSEPGYDATQILVGAATTDRMANATFWELVNGGRLDGLVNADFLEGLFPPDREAVIGLHRNTAWYVLLLGALDKRAEERLAALGWFVTLPQTRSQLDPALVAAVENDTAQELLNTWREAQRGLWTRLRTETELERDIIEIAHLVSDVYHLGHILYLLNAPAKIVTKVFPLALGTFVAIETIRDVRDAHHEARRAVMAATIQRDLAEASDSLDTLAYLAANRPVIDGPEALRVVRLFEASSYLGFKYYNIDAAIWGNLFVEIGDLIGDIKVPGTPHAEYQAALEADRDLAEARHHQFLDTYLLRAPHNTNNMIVNKIRQAPLPAPEPDPEEEPAPTGGGFTFPTYERQEVAGTALLEVTLTDAEAVERVEFSVRTGGSGLLMHACSDSSEPYQCEWDTTTAIWNGAEYDVQAVAYRADEPLLALSSSIFVLNGAGNEPPQIEIQAPDGGSAYEQFQIRWEDDDPDDNATISLHYDTDSAGCDGVEIVRRVEEDWIGDRYPWIFRDVPQGAYWVYAIIDDGVNPPVCAYSPGPVTVSTPVSQDSFALETLEVVESVGDGDGVLDAGEEIEVGVTLRNTSASDRWQVKAQLRSDRLDVAVADDHVAYYGVAAGQASDGAGDFNFRTTPGISATVPLTLNVLYRDSGGGTQYVDVESLSVRVQPDDNAPPAIVAGPTVDAIAPDAALLTWTTDEPADSVVEFGPTAAYGQVERRTRHATTHRVWVRGLEPGTAYQYNVKSSDPSGNGPAEAAGSFTTGNLGNGLHTLEVDYSTLRQLRGMTWDEGRGVLWAVEEGAHFGHEIIQYDPATEQRVGALPVNFAVEEKNGVRGLAFDGTHLWTAYRSNPETIYRLTTEGAVVDAYNWPYEHPTDMAWDGSNLWVSDGEADQICRTDAEAQPVFCFDSPGPGSIYLSWDGSHLWAADNQTGLLYRLTTAGERVGTYPLYGGEAEGLAATAGGELWGALAGLRAGGGVPLVRLQPLVDEQSPTLAVAPMASSDNGTSAVVTWQTDEPANSIVNYGLDSSMGLTETRDLYILEHNVDLSNLQPNMTYYYQAGSQDLAGNAPAFGPPTTVNTAGETHLNVVDSFESNDDGFEAFTFANGEMWSMDRENLYQVDATDGIHVDTLVMGESDDPMDLTFAAGYFYMADDDLEQIFRLNPDTGAVVSSFPTPNAGGVRPSGLTFDGAYLWYLNDYTELYQMTTGGAVISHRALSFEADGLASDGNSLYLYRTSDQRIVRTAFTGDVMATYADPDPTYGVSDLAWDAGSGTLWGLANEVRYQMELAPTLAPVVARVYASQPSTGLTGDTYSTGSVLRIEALEQFGRAGLDARMTISSAADDPGVVDRPMQDLGGGRYVYEWNTAGQRAALDYQVEVDIGNGTYTDTDGLARHGDITLALAPTLSALETYTLDLHSVAFDIRDIAWHGSQFWVSESVSGEDYYSRVDLNSSAITHSCTAPVDAGGSGNPWSIDSDGSYLWLANNISPNTITRHTTGCGQTASFGVPDPDVDEIAWGDGYLWAGSGDYHRIYQLNSSGSILDSFPVDGTTVGNMVWDGTGLWTSVGNNVLALYETESREIIDRRLSTVPIRGLAWDGAALWVSNQNNVHRMGILPDLAIADLAAETAPVPEGVTAEITATVYAHDAPANGAILRFYEGDPDAGGVQIGSDIALGNVSPGDPATAVLPFQSLDAGEYAIYARVDVADSVAESNEANNTVHMTIGVYDTDVEPPEVSSVAAEDGLGDGDGYLEDDESLRLMWRAADDSGVASAAVRIAGNDYPGVHVGDGEFQAIVGPLLARSYPYTVTVTDADNTPETAVVTGTLRVQAHAPAVDNVWPAPAAGDVAASAEITASFDAEMRIETGTVVTGSVKVYDQAGNSLPGAIGYSPEAQDVELNPYLDLEPGATFTVTIPVTDAVTDEIGNALEDSVVWRFTTAPDVEPPRVAVHTPAEGVTVGELVDVVGTVHDATLAGYEIAIGAGSAPHFWTTVFTAGSSPAVNESLGVWDSLAFANGDYVMRVTARDKAGNESTVTRAITVSNSPAAPDILYARPAEGVQMEPVILNVFGHSFFRHARVGLRPAGSDDPFTFLPAQVLNSMEISATVPMTLPVGTYDLLVDNGDGQVASLEQAYRVNPCGLLGDTDLDGRVSAQDIHTLAEMWRQSATAPYDVDGDGQISIIDIMRASALWQETCTSVVPTATPNPTPGSTPTPSNTPDTTATPSSTPTLTPTASQTPTPTPTSTPALHTVSGNVSDGSGQAVEGVLVRASGGHSATTDASGSYVIPDLPAGLYALTPTLAGYTFTPVTSTVSVPPDVAGQDFTGSANDPGWWIEVVDAAPYVSGDTSIGVDPGGNPHIAYRDPTNSALRYAYFDGSEWQLELIHSSGEDAHDPHIAVDGNGRPHVVWDWYTPQNVMYATKVDGSWVVETVESGARSKAMSLALDSGGQPHLAYWTDDWTDRLVHAWRDDGGWQLETATVTGHYTSLPSIALDALGRAHIAYSYSGNDTLYYGVDDGSWDFEIVGETMYGPISLALDAADQPHIAMDNTAAGELLYHYRDGAVWQQEVVGSTGTDFPNVALAFDSQQQAHLAYQFDDSGVTAVGYAHNDGVAWSLEEVAEGRAPWLALDHDDGAHISFANPYDNLAYAAQNTAVNSLRLISGDRRVSDAPR